MKFTITSEHGRFFQENGYIELTDLFSVSQLKRLNEDIQQALVNRLRLPTHFSLEKTQESVVFENGRDLWRNSPSIKKLFSTPSLTEVASELCQKRPLRIGYDQFFPKEKNRFVGDVPQKYGFASPRTLNEVSSIQGTMIGLLVALEDAIDKEADTIFPKTAGHGLFISMDHPLNFDQLDKQANYFLFSYAAQLSVYIANAQDPLGHVLHNWGYTYHDTLSDKLNPIVLY